MDEKDKETAFETVREEGNGSEVNEPYCQTLMIKTGENVEKRFLFFELNTKNTLSFDKEQSPTDVVELGLLVWQAPVTFLLRGLSAIVLVFGKKLLFGIGIVRENYWKPEKTLGEFPV